LNSFEQELALALSNVDSEIVEGNNVIRKGLYKHVFRSLDATTVLLVRENVELFLYVYAIGFDRYILLKTGLTWVTKKIMLH
jgi:hypothetical protein